MLEIKLSNRSKKFLKRCENSIYQRILNKIKELGKDPFPHDAKRVIGRKEKIFRVRVGKYRIEYVVFIEENLLFVTDIDLRKRIFNK